MKERGILFQAPMVRAILEKRKRQTRRLINLDHLRVHLPKAVCGDWPFTSIEAGTGFHRARISDSGAVSVLVGPGKDTLGVKPGEFNFVCPFADGETHLADHGGGKKRWTIVPSESRLWVRETWQPLWSSEKRPASLASPEGWKIGYVATDGVREFHDEDRGLVATCKPGIHMPRWASRLDLSVALVRIERLQDISEEDAIAEGIDTSVVDPSPRGTRYVHAREAFADLWREIHGAESWDANPWLWVVSFTAEVRPGGPLRAELFEQVSA